MNFKTNVFQAYFFQKNKHAEIIWKSTYLLRRWESSEVDLALSNFLLTGKYMFAEYSWNVSVIYLREIRNKFLMESPGIFPNNVPGILNIGTFPECSMNILRMLHVFFRWIKKYNSSFLWWTRLFLIFTLCLWKSNFHRSLIIKAKVM